MCKIEIVLACLACVSHAWPKADSAKHVPCRFVDHVLGTQICSKISQSKLVETSPGTHDPSRAIAQLLLRSHLAAGFHRSHGLFRGCPKTSKRAVLSLNGGIARRDLFATTAAAITVLSQRPLASVAAAAAAPAILAQTFTFNPKITALGALGERSRLEDQLTAPKGAKGFSVSIQLDYPATWAKYKPGIQFIDGSTGVKAYILTAPLPGTSLFETPKAWFGDSIFSPEGTIVRTGTVVDDYKVTSSKQIEAPEGAASPRRRLMMKYAVITPNTQKAIDCKAIVDVFEVGGAAYMFFASDSDSKWESSEKGRCERTADSFIIGVN